MVRALGLTIFNKTAYSDQSQESMNGSVIRSLGTSHGRVSGVDHAVTSTDNDVFPRLADASFDGNGCAKRDGLYFFNLLQRHVFDVHCCFLLVSVRMRFNIDRFLIMELLLSARVFGGRIYVITPLAPRPDTAAQRSSFALRRAPISGSAGAPPNAKPRPLFLVVSVGIDRQAASCRACNAIGRTRWEAGRYNGPTT